MPSSSKLDTVEDYGVWFGRPIDYTVEYEEDDDKSPHIHLTFHDHSQQDFEAAINIKSGDTRDTRLVFWLNESLDPSIVERYRDLTPGFHSLERNPTKGLDYLRDAKLFDRKTGRILPHDIDGPDNDIINVLTPLLDRAKDEKATIYIFGGRYSDKRGIHEVHMNQGSLPKYPHGVQQDGAMFFHYEAQDEWVGVFLGFASQTVETHPKSGLPVKGAENWADLLEGKRHG